jgi:serine/threonine-protein kinase RsbW
VVSATPAATNVKTDAATSPTVELRISSHPTETRLVQEGIERLLKTHQYTDHEIFSIKLAVEEALVNAIKHGNQMDQHRKVHISYRVQPDRFDIHITDEGIGFDPTDVPDPTTPENLERPCGRGLMLMRHYMSEVTFNERGNCVRMSKCRRNGTK